MQLHRWLSGVIALACVVGIVGVLPALADHTIVIGGQCDRTGPTKNVGTQICPGLLDYVKLVNKKAASSAIRSITSKWNMPIRSTAALKPMSGSNVRVA